MTGTRELPLAPLAATPEYDALVAKLKVGDAITQAKRDPLDPTRFVWMLWEFVKVHDVLGARPIWREQDGGCYPWDSLAEVMEQAEKRGLEIVAYYPPGYLPRRQPSPTSGK
jgi:hypothetical protein